MHTKETSFYRPGTCVMCKVEGVEPGGYTASILSSAGPPLANPPEGEESHILAFLPSTEALQIGQVVPATFVCMHNDRALMTFAFMLGTTERIQLSTDSDAENAFAIWVDSYPSMQKTRRAIDLIMPAVSGKLLHELVCSTCDLDKLFAELELANFTGCIKARSETQKSRSAMVLFRGRVVGSIYGRKDMQDPFPVEKALAMIRQDLQVEDTLLQVYELPESVVLAMASLFIGCPIKRDSDQSAKDFIENTLISMSFAEETGCFNLAKNNQPDYLLFVYNGKPAGGYKIGEQVYVENADEILELMKTSSDQLEAHMLPVPLLSQAVTLGYKLSTKGN